MTLILNHLVLYMDTFFFKINLFPAIYSTSLHLQGPDSLLPPSGGFPVITTALQRFPL